MEPSTDRERPTPWYERGLLSPVRRRIAGQRTRYEWNGFDLDLTYISSRVIAMGFPGEGTHAAYRNPRTEVERFLSWAHGGHYRIYNLCAEATHANNGFPDHTVHIPCVDHCPPTMQALLMFCHDAMAWLGADPKNVVAVHCKAGKGRTGVMICSLLVFSGAVSSSYEALRWYELMRGGRHSGVTIPGQIRWVAMFERWIRRRTQGLAGDPMGGAPPHRLRSVLLGPLRDGSGNSNCLSGNRPASVQVGMMSRADIERKKVTYWYPETSLITDRDDMAEVVFAPDKSPDWEHSDGMLIVVVKMGGHKLKLQVWWHHAFLQRTLNAQYGSLVLQVKKEWIDGLHKDVGVDKAAEQNFFLRATFDDCDVLQEPLLPVFQHMVSV